MATFPRPYCESTDLLFEDSVITLSTAVDKDKYVSAAAEEMDSKLGAIYKLPLEVKEGIVDEAGTQLSQLPEHERLLLKSINVRLASGRLYMTVDAANEPTLHAYGASLVKEALADLMVLANGDMLLSAKPQVSQAVDDQTRGPRVKNYDELSLVDGFSDNFMRYNSARPVNPGAT